MSDNDYSAPMTDHIPASFDEAAPLLVPRLVGRIPLANRRLSLQLQGAASAIDEVMPIVGDHAIGLYLDLPESNVPVTTGLLRDWEVTIDDAINVSLLNGQSALADVSRHDEDGSVHLSADFLGASVLLSSRTLEGIVPGRMLILTPTTTDVLIAAADDMVAVEALARRADAIVAAADRTVSVTPLIAEPDDAWAVASWPEAVAKTAGLLHRRWLGLQYAQQRDALRETYENRDEFFPVSSLRVYERPDGWVITTTNLTTTVPTLMPWADQAAVVADDGRVVVASMTDLAAMPGVLAREADIEPPIMRALRFPFELFD